MPGWLMLFGLLRAVSLRAFLIGLSLAAAAQAGPLPIVIDPGHGGQDLGAVVAGRYEKVIALAVARKLKARLQALGAPARLTRDSDDFIPLDTRIAQASAWDGALFISLHANKVLLKSIRGITVYAYGNRHSHVSRRHRRRRLPFLPPPPKDEIRAGAELATWLAASLRSGGFRVGPPDRAQYYVLKNPGAPSLLVEMGYLSNTEEARRLVDPAYQDRIADAIARSLIGYLARSQHPRRPALAGGEPSLPGQGGGHGTAALGAEPSSFRGEGGVSLSAVRRSGRHFPEF